jgi:ubiquinone/menaquinone biosynthesis C-methylase UbiE
VARAAPAAVGGVDPAAAQIDFAQNRPGTKGAIFKVGDAMALPYPDDTVDVATMALVISFVADPGRAVAEMKRVVVPGGYAAAYMWDLPKFGVPLSPIFKVLNAMDLPAGGPPQPEASRIDVMEHMWRSAGFKDVATTAIRIEIMFRDFDDFWESNTLPVGPQAQRIKSLSPDQLAELKRRLRDALPPAADGSIRYEALANAVKGRA